MKDKKSVNRSVLIVALVLCAGSLQAGTITVFQGQDDGAATTGPFTNSNAAQASFETAASGFGSTNTITYESLSAGYNPPIAAATGVSIALTGSNFGAGFSGISDTTSGNEYGFNTTPGGANWLGFPDGTATFTFSAPTKSFGTFLTGLQQSLTTTDVLMITFNDGTSQTLYPNVNVNGGAQFFGFTDTSSFTSLTISDLSDDAWGIDDTTYNSGASSATPEPASFTLLGVGLVGLIVRRLLNKRTA
jgi:hypothetical protein